MNIDQQLRRLTQIHDRMARQPLVPGEPGFIQVTLAINSVGQALTFLQQAKAVQPVPETPVPPVTSGGG